MAHHTLRRLLAAPLDRLIIALGVQMHRHQDAIARATLPRFATEAPGLMLQTPYQVRNPDRIRVGRDVRIGPSSVLKVTTAYPGGWMLHPDGDHVEQTFDPLLEIGDRVSATSGLHVVVYQRVVIEDDVLLAANVYISDGGHALARGDRPYKYQGIADVAPVRIGRGTWIGQNAVVMPGVTIGAYAVVGANAVVTRDVPAGTVVVGAPARPVSRWDPAAEAWERVTAHPREEAARDAAQGRAT